jgi:hypothetical protein
VLTYPDILCLYFFLVYTIYNLYIRYLLFGEMYRSNWYTVDILLEIVKVEGYASYMTAHEVRVIKKGLNILLKREINFMSMLEKYDEEDDEEDQVEYPKVLTWIYLKHKHHF